MIDIWQWALEGCRVAAEPVPRYCLATVSDADGSTAALLLEGAVHPLPGRPAMGDLLTDWESTLGRIEGHAKRGDLDPIGTPEDVRLLAPVPRPPNLYMTGANYADHAREMRKLPPDAPVPRPAPGPFMFLKPTTTVIGHRDEVRIGPGCERMDWEVELAVVIGRRAHRVSAQDAIGHGAGYPVANDVSARDQFVREDAAEPPMRFDWFSQKGWATSCPMGPWLVPADQLPGAQDLAMTLTLHGEGQQQSRTSQMIFSIAEQIEFVSSVVPLVP